MIKTRSECPVDIGSGVNVTWEAPLRKLHGFQQAIDLTFRFGEDITIGVISHAVVRWITNKFHTHRGKVVIGRQEYHFDDGDIVKIVQETITLNSDSFNAKASTHTPECKQ